MLDAKPNQLNLNASVVFAGLLSWCIYAGISLLSRHFSYEVPGTQRPLLWVLGLLAVAFFIYLFCLRQVLRLGRQPDVGWIVVLFALAFRAVLVFSEPIQEIDIYRYVWDGLATRHGVNPFLYSPAQVLNADPTSELPEDLLLLTSVRDSSPAVHTLLTRVHYGDLPTVYPPTSQLVFAAAAFTTRQQATAYQRLLLMKLWVVAFDVGTIFVIAAMLRHVNAAPGWLLAYAWCPLVLKEFANSGHLDSIAVFLTSAGVYLALLGLFPKEDQAQAKNIWRVIAAAFLLALAFGAKLYPVILVPLLLTMAYRNFGVARVIGVSAAFALPAVLLSLPMLDVGGFFRSSTSQLDNRSPSIHTESPAPTESAVSNPSEGLRAFLSSWMMNDFIFLNVIENLTPDAFNEPSRRAWFVVTPDSWRERLVTRVGQATSLPRERIPFAIARFTTAVIFIVIALWWACWAGRQNTADAMLQAAFLTTAWFWLLLPTLNPWYWTWALPFISHGRSRAWLWLSGITLVYYLRFYFVAHYEIAPVVRMSDYTGPQFFDYVVTWFEYAPWFFCLIAGYVRNRLALHRD